MQPLKGTVRKRSSLGVIYWEMVTRLVTGSYLRPYAEYTEIKYDYQIIYQTAVHGKRPTFHVRPLLPCHRSAPRNTCRPSMRKWCRHAGHRSRTRGHLLRSSLKVRRLGTP